MTLAPDMIAPERRSVAPIRDGVLRFITWLEDYGYASYDPYDAWGTRAGVRARTAYYRDPLLGIPLVAPFLLMEIVWPRWRSLVLKRQRYAVADAHLAKAYLNLHRATGEQVYKERATGLAEDLVAQSSSGYHGHCWGYPFDWQSNRKLYRKGTPFITTTPYVFEVFLDLFDLTQETSYLEVAESIARFAAEDLHDTDWSPTASASSYSPEDRDKVVNASAYRAFVLMETAARTGMDAYRTLARRNLNFVLETQRDDGSWWYAMGDESGQFIDHFHTCFVLKNLFKLNRHLQDSAVTEAIERGFAYYRQCLFDESGFPVPFSVRPRMQLVRLELYDLAEAISLGVLLRDLIPEALPLAVDLSARGCRRMQLPDGHFVTREYRGGIRHTVPFLRWAQAPMLYALTNVWTACEAGECAA